MRYSKKRSPRINISTYDLMGLISRLGGVKYLAGEINVSENTVRTWLSTGIITSKSFKELESKFGEDASNMHRGEYDNRLRGKK